MYKTIPLLLLLAACDAVPPDRGSPPDRVSPVPRPGQPDDCGAGQLSSYIGRSAEALPPRDGRVRLIPPNTPVTMDFFPERLNAELDADGTIVRLWCG